VDCRLDAGGGCEGVAEGGEWIGEGVGWEGLLGGGGERAGGGEGELIKKGRRGRELRHVVPLRKTRRYSGMFASGSSSRIAAGIMVRS